jgi:hypothetical protein
MVRTFYDPLDHSYYIDGRRVVSVTQALKLSGRIDDRWFTDAGRERGLHVHACCEAIDRRATLPLTPVSLGDEASGYIEAYRAFLIDHRPRWTHIEKGFFHVDDDYGGRPDRVGVVRGYRATVEIKTGSEADWHGLQLAGYQGLNPAGARHVLYLKSNGRFKFVRCARAADYPEFREALLYARAALTGSGVPI